VSALTVVLIFFLAVVFLDPWLLARLSLILEDLLLGFLPPRFVATYSQVKPRLEQREQIGLSLEHFSLEEAQASQLSRSFGAEGAVAFWVLGDPGELDRIRNGAISCTEQQLREQGGERTDNS
jgi:hypothetical protein